MPINKKHRLLFVHIPKNAGSSAAKLIKSYPDNRHTFNKETLYGIDPSNGLVLQSMPYKFYKLYLDNYKNFTKFTIIRNPYDRFLSDYSWDNRGNQTPLQYAQWIQNLLKNNSWDELLKYNQAHTNHILPQYYYLLNEENNLCKDIKLIKLENLKEDIKDIENIIGESMPYVNKTSHRTLNIEDLDSQTIALINLIYKKDFEYLKYSLISPNNWPNFIRISDNKIYNLGPTQKLGWPKSNRFQIPDEYIENGEFMVMRLCNGLGDWGIISALPRMLKEKYPHCKVYLPSKKMIKSIFGESQGWKHWPNPEKNVERIFQNNPYVDKFVDRIEGEIFHDHYRIYEDNPTSLIEQMLLFWGFTDEECINYEPELYFNDKEKEKGDEIIKKYFGDKEFGGFICSNSQLEKGKFWEDERDNNIKNELKKHSLKYVYYGGINIEETPFSDYIDISLDFNKTQIPLRIQLYIRSKAKINIGYQSSMFELICRYSQVICTEMNGGVRENKFDIIEYI